jgi:hypothetical protein
LTVQARQQAATTITGDNNMWTSRKPGLPGHGGWLAVVAAALIITGCGGGGDGFGAAAPGSVLAIKTVNNRADLISDGDAMVEVVLPAGVAATALKVDLNGRDISSAFALRANGRIMGLVTGLAEGANVLSASAQGPVPPSSPSPTSRAAARSSPAPRSRPSSAPRPCRAAPPRRRPCPMAAA